MMDYGNALVKEHIPDFHLMRLTEEEGFNIPDRYRIAKAVYCERSTPVPYPNDDIVVTAGYPLYIYSYEEWGPTSTYENFDIVAVLEKVDGIFVYRVIEGDIGVWAKYVDDRLYVFNNMPDAE